MSTIINNWYIIVGFIAIITVVSLYVYKFFKLPTNKQISNIKEWLKYAVTIAEKELGKGTGQLKLRYVYNLFIEKYPDISKIVTFEVFSNWVDEALEWLKYQLEQNNDIKNMMV